MSQPIRRLGGDLGGESTPRGCDRFRLPVRTQFVCVQVFAARGVENGFVLFVCCVRCCCDQFCFCEFCCLRVRAARECEVCSCCEVEELSFEECEVGGRVPLGG